MHVEAIASDVSVVFGTQCSFFLHTSDKAVIDRRLRPPPCIANCPLGVINTELAQQ